MGGALARARRDADLWVLAALIVLMAVLGRDFARISVPGTPAYVTEAAMAIILVLALVRLGVRPAVALLRDRLPLVPLLVYWVAGAVAIARGLHGWGFELTKYDVGLVEFSVLLPLTALVASDPTRLRELIRIFAGAGAASSVLYVVDYVLTHGWDVTWVPSASGGTAAGLYAALFPVYVLARIVYRLPVSVVHVGLAAIGLLAVGLTTQRGSWLGVLLAMMVVAAAGIRTGAKRQHHRHPVAIATATVIAAVFLGAATYVVESSLDKGQPGAPQAQREISGLVNTGQGGQEGENPVWRLDFWHWSFARAVRKPIAGVGYGVPMDFRWHGKKYDTRLRVAGGGRDVSGPHNEFVHIAYRMGLFALAALVVLIAFAAVRLLTTLRDPTVGPTDRALTLALGGMVVAGLVATGFNDALKGPFIALFVWAPLGLALVVPALLTGRAERPDSESRSLEPSRTALLPGCPA